jgi:hypothetical protein
MHVHRCNAFDSALIRRRDFAPRVVRWSDRFEACEVVRGARLQRPADGWSGYAADVSAEREELRRLVEQLPDEEIPAVLAEVRRHLVAVGERSWPPAFFGAGRAGRSDVAARSEEILGEGFGRSA